jgi:outer membrane receptor protein involved in Fe transport
VNVVGERETNRIDRQVYDVKSDVNSSNGSAADALGNVPSVGVDPDGTVSLRGSTNVQILVDGKPSAMLQGDNRGPVLQAMPAEDIDSVEVINNPGAEFGNEGGGGPILNLVMKRSRRPGGFGVVNANYGHAGRYNSAAERPVQHRPLGCPGRRQRAPRRPRLDVSETERDRIDPRTGVDQHTSTTSSSTGLNDRPACAASSPTTWARTTRWKPTRLHEARQRQHRPDRYTIANDGTPYSDYLRTSKRSGDNTNSTWGARWDHKGEKLGELFRMDLRVSNSDNEQRRPRGQRLPARAAANRSEHAVFERRWRPACRMRPRKVRIVDYTGDYEPRWRAAPSSSSATRSSTPTASSTTATSTSTRSRRRGLAERALTNAFEVDERDAALYGSYQWKVSERWGALVGLRTEYTHMDLDQITTQTAPPTLPELDSERICDLQAESDNQPALRLRAPDPPRHRAQLNPFVVYQDELNESSGNPNLKPVQTDSFEIGYETKAGKLDANLRAYYRADRDMIRSRQTAVSDTVLLTTLETAAATAPAAWNSR